MMDACLELAAQEGRFSVDPHGYVMAVLPGSEERLNTHAIYNGPAYTASSMMTKAPTDLEEFIKSRLTANTNVRALMIGRSEEVHHIWSFLDEWTTERRKEIYKIQREILEVLGSGMSFDFYVVDLPQGAEPCEMVSEIPLVFLRT